MSVEADQVEPGPIVGRCKPIRVADATASVMEREWEVEIERAKAELRQWCAENGYEIGTFTITGPMRLRGVIEGYTFEGVDGVVWARIKGTPPRPAIDIDAQTHIEHDPAAPTDPAIAVRIDVEP